MRIDPFSTPDTTEEDAGERAQSSTPTEAGAEDERAPTVPGEFRLTIRKLELPVRPRGVLAE